METLWSLVIAALIAGGVYLLLERHILRMLFGVMMLSNAINLLIFVGGRLTHGQPALIDPGQAMPASPFANPLPQALVLTAIVIGFGLLIFALVLAWRAYGVFRTSDADALTHSEKDSDAC